MEVQYHNDIIPYTIIDNFYNKEELDELWNELLYICHPRRLRRSGVDDYGAAFDENQILKDNYCQYLDTFWGDRESSSILSITMKLFEDNVYLINDHPHWMFDVSNLGQHYTQLVYYEHAHQYRAHYDKCVFTALTWFYKEPKKYTGGDLSFPEYNVNIECLNNRCVIFPSIIRHAVNPLIMNEDDRGKQNGRFCISQFLTVPPVEYIP